MRILGSMVMKNEADRYLVGCLRHMRPFFDDMFVWDDQSDDDSPNIASDLDCAVHTRGDDVPSFLEHEGQFRFAAWKAMERLVSPEPGDWVLSFDADEFLVGTDDDFSDVRGKLEQAITSAEKAGQVGVVLPFPEIFGIKDGVPQVRTDGLWDTIRGPRLFKYLPEAEWSDKPMGCGSEPTYVARGPLSSGSYGLHMLHFGYADEDDHAKKHERYTELYDHGHNNSHIQSIIANPTLEAWSGPIPMWSFE